MSTNDVIITTTNLTGIKALKEETIYNRILSELRVKGLNDIIKKINKEQIDYLDIVIDVINFLTVNSKLYKKLNSKNYENLVIICVDEILESQNIDLDEEQIRKIIILLNSSLLMNKFSKMINNLLNKSKCL